MSSSWYGLGVRGEAEAGTPAPGSGAVPCPVLCLPLPNPPLPPPDEEQIPEPLLYASNDSLEHSHFHRFTGLMLC